VRVCQAVNAIEPNPNPSPSRCPTMMPCATRVHGPWNLLHGQAAITGHAFALKNWAPGAGTDPWAKGSTRGQGPPQAATMRARGAAADHLGNLPTAERAFLVVE
jgi:hypothetical protein